MTRRAPLPRSRAVAPIDRMRPEQAAAVREAVIAATRQTDRSALPNAPLMGKPRPGGHLVRRAQRSAPHILNDVSIWESDYVFAAVAGFKHRRAIFKAKDYMRLTRRDVYGPFLDGRGIYMDEDRFLRSSSRHERPGSPGILIAAALLSAHEGDTIEVPADPFDLRLSQLRRID